MRSLVHQLWYWASSAETLVVSFVCALGRIIGTTEFISALAGAFCGAGAAFLLESRRRQREKRERQHEVLLRAQSALLAQANSLGWFEAQYPEDNRFDNLKTIVLGFTSQTVDFDGLGFLGASSRPQLITELDVANGSFEQFKRLTEFRNDTIEEFFRHPETKVLEFNDATGHIRAVGPLRLKFKLQQANKSVSHAFQSAKERNQEAVAAPLAFAQREFRGMHTHYPSSTSAQSNRSTK
jgi:hypothetical protein